MTLVYMILVPFSWINKNGRLGCGSYTTLRLNPF